MPHAPLFTGPHTQRRRLLAGLGLLVAVGLAELA